MIEERWDKIVADCDCYLKDSFHNTNKLAGLGEILALLNKYYLTIADTTSFSAEHDVLYIHMPNVESLSDGHIMRLSQLGVHWDHGAGCLAIFT